VWLAVVALVVLADTDLPEADLPDAVARTWPTPSCADLAESRVELALLCRL
jgi:hypothetical protein